MVKEEHWLDHYGSNEYRWQKREQNNRTTYYRPLGLVECWFDGDGRYFEGRADLTAELDLEVKSSLSKEDFRERVLFAWTCLRCKHLLIQARAIPLKEFYERDTVALTNIGFAIEAPRTITQAIEDAAQHLVFLSDHFEHVDPLDFWTHCANTGRVIDPQKALSCLFVFDLEPQRNGHSMLRFLKIGGHQIEDGMTTYTWFRDFLGFLNQPLPIMRERLRELLEPGALFERLPPPQEALYPPISGSWARQKWFWLLSRILRHVRKPLEASHLNPLRRYDPKRPLIPLPHTYESLLDYSKRPPLSSIPLFATVTLQGTQRLHRLCKEVKASVGAGCFALAALIMQEFYEVREPDIPLHKRQPFISGFPLNPRAFYDHRIEPDSLMLAFCDGILLPFLPSNLDLDGRLRLLTRQAHRQLAAYQKRKNPDLDPTGLMYMSSRGVGRLLANQYIMGVERLDTKLPEQFRSGLNPQGAYPMRPNMTLQTCGVSSVGRTQNIIEQGTYDLNDETKDFVADYRRIYANVRPRDDEFLVGVGSNEYGLWVNGSIDGNAMEPSLVEQWKRRFETILDEDEAGLSSKL